MVEFFRDEDIAFQPTPSTRRVTLVKCEIDNFAKHFNPHPPQGG